MARRSLLLAATLVSVAPPSLAAERGRFALAGGFVVPTVLYSDGQREDSEPGPLLLITYDHPYWDRLELGGFLHVAGFTADGGREPVNLFSLGAAAHVVTPFGERGELRLGAGLGYRRLFASVQRFDAVHGIAVNLDAELAYPLAPNFTGLVEIGALAQPIGSNGDHEVSFLPFPYLALGMAF